MQIRKWRHLITLFAWQRKRALILLVAFVIALILSAALDVAGADAESRLARWPPELGDLAIVGLLISFVVVVLND